MSLTALKKLAASSKATVLVGALVVMGVLVYLGKIDGQQMLDTVKYLIPAWMAAHAGEQGAKALANGKALEALAITTAAAIVDKPADDAEADA